MPSLKQNDCTRVYDSNQATQSGLQIWRAMVHELVESRGLIWRLLVLDIGSGLSLAMTLRMLVTPMVYPRPTKRPDITFIWRDVAERVEPV